MRALVIAECLNDQLKSSTANLVAAAQQTGLPVDVYLMGDAEKAVETAKHLSYVEKLWVSSKVDPALMSESVAKSVVQLAKENYSHIFFEASSFGKSVMPRVAALLDVEPMSDVIRVADDQTFERPIYAGRIEETLRNEQAFKVATIRTTVFAPVGYSGQAQLTMCEAMPETMKSKKLDFEAIKSDRPALQSAKIVVAGGRGLEDEEGFALLGQLADKLGAAIGATRAVVDLGLCPNDWQVGQTGKIVAPDVYIGFGISGAMQHISGIKDSKMIVAFDTDPEAPIFEVADFGMVMDAKTAVKYLIEKL